MRVHVGAVQVSAQTLPAGVAISGRNRFLLPFLIDSPSRTLRAMERVYRGRNITDSAGRTAISA